LELKGRVHQSGRALIAPFTMKEILSDNWDQNDQ